MSSFEQLPPPVEATGSARQMRQSKFLDAYDLEQAGVPIGGQATVTIETVLRRDNVKSQFTNEPQTLWTLRLVGKSKELRCYAATQKVLVQAFGENFDDWKNQKIVLVRAQSQDRKTGELRESIVVQVPRGSAVEAVKKTFTSSGDDIPF